MKRLNRVYEIAVAAKNKSWTEIGRLCDEVGLERKTVLNYLGRLERGELTPYPKEPSVRRNTLHQQIDALLAEGRSKAEIMQALGAKPSTIQQYSWLYKRRLLMTQTASHGQSTSSDISPNIDADPLLQ